MFVGQAHSFTQQARLAITLAWVAGFTNILTILTCGTVTSHVSGTVSQWGLDLVEGRWSLIVFTSYLLLTFISGAMLSAFCTETGRRRGWESIYVLPMTVQAMLLAMFAATVAAHDTRSVEKGVMLYAMTGLASMAMGLQNATITRISGGVVRTTHMTGVFTDLGLETVQFLYWLGDRHRDSPPLPTKALIHSVRVHPTAKRLALLGSVVGSFALGAGLGAAAYDRFSNWAMVLPVAFLLWIVIRDIRVPISEIESSQAFGAAGGMDLPESLAVYHLRRDKGRRGRVHRFPDLLRWCEGLPESRRIVILDLGEASVLDANAALELRALIKQSAARGRKMVISGISGEQYRAMREAGAGDALDPTNVCPDLELAIARGLMLAESRARED
jgi:uncharacterized membrane protein YoaK (UPF0700 family)/anti-anti-sigma regulatory factor